MPTCDLDHSVENDFHEGGGVHFVWRKLTREAKGLRIGRMSVCRSWPGDIRATHRGRTSGCATCQLSTYDERLWELASTYLGELE